jgi:hypothetical protein
MSGSPSEDFKLIPDSFCRIEKMFDETGPGSAWAGFLLFCGLAERRNLVGAGKGPMEAVAASDYRVPMNPILLILLLVLLFGGGGFYFGGPMIGGGGLGLILVICLIVYLMGGWRTKS